MKTILISLSNALKAREIAGHRALQMPRLDASAFFTSHQRMRQPSSPIRRKYESLFDSTPDVKDDEDADEFCQSLVDDLVDRLDGPVRLPLSESDKSLLAAVAQATLEMERQRRALDTCGMRYLLSVRMFANQNRRAGTSGTQTPASGVLAPPTSATSRSGRLSFRNIVWAMHSESPDVLLAAATDCCRDRKMLWSDAKLFGVFLWLKSREIIVRCGPSVLGLLPKADVVSEAADGGCRAEPIYAG